MSWKNWNRYENESLLDTLEKELPQSSLYYLLISIVSAIAWVVYLTYYNSRVIGLILTAVLNKFYKYGHVHLGSFSVSVLSGKIMFRDVHIVNEDFSLRIQLGHAIFRWWRPLAFKNLCEDLSHEETRLSVYLDTFELHVYSRSENFSRLERLFGLDSLIIPNKEDDVRDDSKSDNQSTSPIRPQQESKWQWRDLVPVIKFEISSGRVVFGNYLVPTTLSITFGEANLVYTTKPPSTQFDEFMRILKCRAEHMKVMFVPSPKYQGGLQDEPPRFMGDGFVILQSNDVDIYYYHDEPGLVDQDQDFIELADGDVIACRTCPCWGMDIKCGKGTDISYGPWADRQREFLYKFFYPADYLTMETSTPPGEGEKRVPRSFDFKMSMQNDATVDVLFSKNKETQAIHMNCRQGSYLEFTIPWIIEEAGYVSRVNAQLMRLDATTSLQFRSFIECETLEVNVEVEYPRNWNEHQLWKVEITACKSSVYFIFDHKVFFMDLVEDWSSKARPDLYSFVPYTWSVNLMLKEFELMTVCNEWNWIHCFGSPPENAQLAFCGDTFDMTFSLPFTDFLPPTVPLKFFIRGESLDARLYLPETNTSRHLILALSQSMRIMGRDGVMIDHPFVGYDKWRGVTQKSAGWVDVWTTPIVAISIGYTYHPMPPNGEHDRNPDNPPLTTPEAEEMLLTPLRLIPLRPPRPKKFKDADSSKASTLEDFDPTTMAADEIAVELEVGPSVVCAYGSILKNFLHIKENYLGEDQKFTDFSETMTSHLEKACEQMHATQGEEQGMFDPRYYRPLHVKVQAALHDIQAHLVKNCNEGDPPCPCAFIERVGFEMDKKYEQTELQVLISPAVLLAKDQWQERGEVHQHLSNGHLALSGLQVRGHAMFSHKNLPLDAETLEYAWLVEVTIGDITGKLTAPQLQGIIEALQTFVFLVEDSENDLQRAVPHYTCQHGVPQPECTESSTNNQLCPSSEDLKYRLTRVSIDCLDLYLTEAGSALNVQVYPVRLSTCNLHGKNNKAGITALIPQVNLKQFVLSIPTTQSYKPRADVWLEAGGVCFGPVNVDAAMALPGPEYLLMQDKFMKIHDERTHRLWFLWSPDVLLDPHSRQGIGKCGCWGGCKFFGSNRNGPRFFNPSPQDYEDGRNVAALMIVEDGSSLGFGQSLLQPKQYMFELNPQVRSASSAKKRGMLRRQMAQSHDSTLGSVTDDSRASTLVGNDRESAFPDRVSSVKHGSYSESNVSSEHTLTGSLGSGGVLHGVGRALSAVDEYAATSNPRSSLLSSDYFPEGSIPDAYDTDRMVSPSVDSDAQWQSQGSISSLPNIASTRQQRGHERSHSSDPNYRLPPRSVPVSVRDARDAASVTSSQRSSSGTSDFQSRQPSLTSPVLRRISPQLSVHHEGSTTSLMSSDKFFSAVEDAGTDSMGGSAYHLNGSILSDTEPNITVIPNRGFRERAAPARPDLPCSKLPHAGSATSTDSTLSFVSAVSSQKSMGPPMGFGVTDSEDDVSQEEWDTELENDKLSENFVDLHGQMNQQITKSSLLMCCYMSHMTQLKCSCWSAVPPIPTIQQTVDEDLTSPLNSSDNSQCKHPPENGTTHGPAWIPQFAYINEGFTPRLMVTRKEPITPPGLHRSHSPTGNDKPSFFPASDQDLPNLDDTAFSFEDHVSQTTAIVKLKGFVDIMFSPLMLEALQRYIEAVTPVLANIHPSAVVDALHFQCSSAVKGQNKLKKQESEKEPTEVHKEERSAKNNPTGGLCDQLGATPYPTPKPASQAELEATGQKRTSQLQVMFSLSRINICILQASLVEEVIAFSAIDRVKELTCVSVLAACLDDIQCQILMSNVSQKTLEPITDSTAETTAPQKPSGRDQKHSSLERGEVNLGLSYEAAEMVEHQQEDIVGSLNIARIHFQLRRMKKDSNFSDHVSLTAIPEHRSKVLFTFQKQHVFSPGTPDVSHDHDGSLSDHETTEDIAGFIMFECGLEDIQLKAAKRSGYNNNKTGSTEADGDTTKPSKPSSFTHSPEFPKPSGFPHHSGIPGVRLVKPSVDQDSDVESSPETPSTHNSADDEASVPECPSLSSNAGSRGTYSSSDTLRDDTNVGKLQGNASSCVLEFKTVWFNFAAPPPSPKKRKLEFTRMDWNLLSTATPGINAWMNPCHRAIVAARTLVRCLEERVCTVTACIMMEAVRVGSIHMPIKSKFNKTTLLSRTLQEDPSCQLLTVLRRYIHKVGITEIETSLDCDTIPQLLTMKKGILALTREWKNVLYMPSMAQGKGKKKTPQFTVTFAFPPQEIIEDMRDDITLDHFDLVDEKTSLLKAEGGSVMGESEQSFPRETMPLIERSAEEGADGKTSSASLIDEKKIPGAKKKNSLESPGIKSGTQPGNSFNMLHVNPRLKRNESNTSFHSLSTSSIEQLATSGRSSLPGTPLHQSLTPHLRELCTQDDEDLYRWMQRQQESTRIHGLNNYPSMGHDSLAGVGGISEYSHDDSMSIQPHVMPQPAFQQDAQVLFKPLLRAVGLQLEAVKMSAIMKKFGGNMSIKGVLKALRVDIVDSETSATRKKPKSKVRIKRLPKFHIDTGFETPAFLCDTFVVLIAMKDVVDFEKQPEGEVEESELRRRSRTLRFALDNFQAKPTTTCVNLRVSSHSVTQHVNMSLLRLIHQFVTMIENINETRIELKGVANFDGYKGHRKQDSKSSAGTTNTDTHSVDNELHRLTSMTSTETETPISDTHVSPFILPSSPKLPGSSAKRPVPGTPQPLHRPDRLPLGSTRSPHKNTRRCKQESPINSFNFSDSVGVDVADTSSPAIAEKTIIDEIKEHTPKCWRDLYHLLDIYASVPQPKTISRSRLSVIDEEPDKLSDTPQSLHESVHVVRNTSPTKLTSKLLNGDPEKAQSKFTARTYTGSTFTQSIFMGERIPLVVFGTMKLKRIRISAMLSGLKLEADLQNVHSSSSHRERVKGVIKRRSRETSATAHVGHAMIILLEGVPPSMQTVVTVNVAQSGALYSSTAKRSRQHNSGLVTIGSVGVDIPQHPVVLHGMVARSSKRLSTTLQEFIRHNPPKISRSHDSVDTGMPIQQPSKHSDLNDFFATSAPSVQPPKRPDQPSKPFVIHFKAVLKGLTIGASLLPSLKAMYKMGEVTGNGVTGEKARFNVGLPTHSLSFTSKVQPDPVEVATPQPYAHLLRRKRLRKSLDESVKTPSNLPSSASIELPPIYLHADLRQHKSGEEMAGGLSADLCLLEGNYFNAVAEVGTFEHSLTTDLLNHLVFVQKVFMKEVNEVVQKVSGADQPVRLWGEESSPAQHVTKPLLYSVLFRLQGIQITATTPTSNAVRLETESIELMLSNRVQRASKRSNPVNPPAKLKLFVEVQVDLNLALGTLIKNPMFEEADPELQHLAWFKTVISLRNALQDEIIPGMSQDQEALLISCKRPVVCVQPSAFDKAVLVWLNYKNAYEYWNEQRLSLNKEVQTATQQVFDKFPLGGLAPPQYHPATGEVPGTSKHPAGGTSTSSTPSQPTGTLFLQLTVEDVGICLPMNHLSQVVHPTSKMGEEPRGALVLTLENTQISACSHGSLVSKGKFKGFCLRFADDFEVSWDDWKPNKSKDDIVMNALVVPDGTYEVCSQTKNAQASDHNAKWILNITWQMQGIDIHLDTNIGQRLSMLGDTINVLYGEEEDIFEEGLHEEEGSDQPLLDTRRSSFNIDGVPEFVYDMTLDTKTRARLLEKEMNTQAKNLEKLRLHGAEASIIEMEERKLQDLETFLFHEFRQDLMKKLKKQSEKVGLGYKPAPSGAARPKSLAYTGRLSSLRQDYRRLQSCDEQPERMHGLGAGRAVSIDVASMDNRRDLLRASKRHGILELDSDDGDDEMEETELSKTTSHLHPGENQKEDTSHNKAASPSLGGSGGSGQKATLEPSIDFELDIKVNIDRGQCVLHPKEAKGDSDFDKSRGGRVSPRADRKKSNKKVNLEAVSNRLLHPVPIDNTTNFFLPGLDVKVHYTSKVVTTEGSQSPASSRLDVDSGRGGSTPSSGSNTASSSGSGGGKRTSIKKLYGWVSLQQLSEEMLISPALLDFLEQALEPIPLTLLASDKTASKSGGSVRGDANSELDAISSSLISSGTYSAYATSLPIDVVVYILVKPSLIRFTCLPVSRVECLLRLPSVDLVFSSKKSDIEGGLMSESSPANKGLGKRVSSGLTPHSGMRASSSQRIRTTSGHTSQQETSASSGGLSVTACLADFSLYIFHPYGGGQKKTTLSVLENTFRKTHNTSAQSPLGDTGRKDSLSLNVEFVKVNISRSRRGVVLGDVATAAGSSAKLFTHDSQRKAANHVRFSAVCDIGSASFKYDMRRLPEILALPKAWYRRTLARRMFLGEETAFFDSDSDEDLLLSSTPPSPPDSPGLSPYDRDGRAHTITGLHSIHQHKSKDKSVNQHRRVASENKNVPLNVDFRQELMDSSRLSSPSSAPQSPSEERHRAFLPRHAHFDIGTPSTAPSAGNYSRTAAAIREWETMVLFAVNLSELDVAVNMSNVMGNTVWSTKDLKSQGRLSIDSAGYKNMKISAGLSSSKLDARAGIVGGCIEIHQVNTMLSVCEEAEREPEHKVSAGIYSLETRLDYMGSSILMARLSMLNVILTDYWKVDQTILEHQHLATRRPTEIYVNGDLGWEKFHMMISRSTTPDLLKLASKLEEFFSQQFTSSKRVFSTFGGPGGTVRSSRIRPKNSQEDSWISEIRHHRHWQRVMEKICGCKLSLLGVTLPPSGAYLGGSVTLHGLNLTLACFHGINFRSKSWGLFTMEEPYIRFTTDATDLVDDEGGKCMHIIQSLIFQLGHNMTEIRQKRPMAMVCKISRGHYMPPPFTSVQDWFHYAFATSEIKDLDSFPVIERHGNESPGERRAQRRQQYSHDTEVIFVLPSLLLTLETRHMQGEFESSEDDPRPVVECSFITQFEDHIFVAMDAEVLLFLHDLVINYVKEKDKGATPKAQRSPESEKKNLANPTTVLKQDLRDFDCKTWCLEPTVRLLSWAGKRIDPVGVDYILQKLGFQHARLTIPKWMQRGCMDPLDKILSVLITQLVLMLGEEEGKN